MKTKTAILTTALIFSGMASAGGGTDFYDRAKVVDVQPIVEEIEIVTPERHCTKRGHHSHRRHHRHHDSATPEIIGGIIGGVVGNQFGNGSGKRIMTAAGAVLGASIAHDMEHDSHARPHKGRHCRIEEKVRYEEQVTGYRVKYRYDGRTFWTEMDEDPGKTIKVRVSVEPLIAGY